MTFGLNLSAVAHWSTRILCTTVEMTSIVPPCLLLHHHVEVQLETICSAVSCSGHDEVDLQGLNRPLDVNSGLTTLLASLILKV